MATHHRQLKFKSQIRHNVFTSYKSRNYGNKRELEFPVRCSTLYFLTFRHNAVKVVTMATNYDQAIS